MRGGKDRKIYVTWQDGDLLPILPDCQMKQIKVISAQRMDHAWETCAEQTLHWKRKYVICPTSDVS